MRRRRTPPRSRRACWSQAIRNDLKPRDIITRKSIENAIALVMATGGSTNAVLHYLAIASAAEVPWTIDDFERMRQRVPVLCDLKPSGKYVAVDFHRAGGVPQVLKMLLKAGLLHGDCMTITGRTMAEELAHVPDAAARGPGRDPAVRQADVRAGPSRDPARQSRAGRLRGEDHRPQESRHHRARARIRFRERGDGRDHGAQDQGRRRHRDPLRRPEGRSRACRRCWRRRPR